MNKGSAQIPLVLMLVVLAVSLPMAMMLINQNTENRSKATGQECPQAEQCPFSGDPNHLYSCHPGDIAGGGDVNDSLCSWTGRVETCGADDQYWCCPSAGGAWTQNMTDACIAAKNAKLTPTTTQSSGSSNFNFVVTFAGIKPEAKCASNLPLKVVMKDKAGNSKEYTGITVTKLSDSKDGLAKYSANVNVSGLSSMAEVSAFIKGPKHLQTKFGMDGQTQLYNQEIGKLDLTQNKTYDFSGYAMMAGDVNGDGSVDGQDFSQLKTAAMARTSIAEGGYMVEDLNGNCQMESQDVTLLMITLNSKQELLY